MKVRHAGQTDAVHRPDKIKSETELLRGRVGFRVRFFVYTTTGCGRVGSHVRFSFVEPVCRRVSSLVIFFVCRTGSQ